MDYRISHDTIKHRFTTSVGGYQAILNYREILDGTIQITHTCVPKQIEGRGVAASLTQAIVEYAVEAGVRIIPICSYAASYFKRKSILF